MAVAAGSLDTNVLLRLVLNDIPDQNAAVLHMLASRPGEFHVADIAIIEMAFVLGRAYEFTREQVAEVIWGIMDQPRIICNRQLFETVLPLYSKRSSLSFEDCCLSVYAQLQDAVPLWTFDQKLAKQAESAKLVTARR